MTDKARPNKTGAAEAAGYRLGLSYMFVATLFTSIAGIVLRLVEEADGWQVLFYRSSALVVTLVPFIAWRYGAGAGRAFLAIGRPGLVAAACLAGAFALFIFALYETTVANVVFTIGLSPFFAALFAWVVLREALAPATWAAMLVAVAGIALMVGDGLASGTLLGNALALGACLCYSAALVAMRKGREADMIPAVCLAGVLATLVSWLAAPDLGVSGRDLGLAATLGVVQLGFQYILVTAAIRHVPAAEVALIGRASLVLAPIWVWLGVGEVPSTLTLIGGAVVFAAITGHGVLALRRSRAALSRSGE
ncbi:MAG: DMT family transporter [Proteobacteria bacterium]|nr:DMT family transporter [Pseudomonadota bacterium]